MLATVDTYDLFAVHRHDQRKQTQPSSGPLEDVLPDSTFLEMANSPLGSLLHQPRHDTNIRAAIQTQANRRYATFSTTILTNQPFLGHPVTPSDKYQRRIDFPIATLETPTPIEPPTQHFGSLTQQFRSHLLQWQRPMFGPIR